MRLLQRSETGEFSLTKNFIGDEAIPRYAILSHTWGADTEEVTFDDLVNNIGKDKPGYEKIRFCGEQARQDDLQYFWIDTCCINKANKAELSFAINSMFRWYRNAARCYVYLSDVSTAKREVNGHSKWEPAFRRSRWFTRGWTLQELLAPSSVEFFSQERKRLGDRNSLRQLIHELTAIPELALQGALLSQFSVNDRLSWVEHRQTKLEEDKAYSLLGIFGVYVPPIYGEGTGAAFRRLLDEIRKVEKCTQDLHLTDPRRDKARIEGIKGGLLEGSYYWIFGNPDFQRWRDNPQSRLLWIKGDPGKGKTMLFCGIINELKRPRATTHIVSYFFCQATDSRINSATAVLRGLLYLLVDQQPSLVSHIRKKHDNTGKALFEDANAWVALSEIFTDILRDPSLNSTYLLVDALDECVKDLPDLLDFIVQKSSISSRVKWMLTSRNEAHIEQRLRLDDSGTRLSLELKENAAQISRAVDAYIDHRLPELKQIQNDTLLQDSVRVKMQQKANSTFLWVSLVIKELKDVMTWEILQVLDEVPTELKDMYRRMLEQIKQLKRQYPELCRRVLSTVIATYRPLHLQELHVLSGLPTQTRDVNQATATIVKMCGSFLTIREDNVYIIHQSAKDFLSEGASYGIFPSGTGEVHRSIFSRSLHVMSRTLKRDMYNLRVLGYPAAQVKPPDTDPLVASRYSCIYWIDHFCDWSDSSSENHEVALQDGGAIDSFLRKKYLYWLEALSLCKSMPKGVISMTKLEALTNEIAAAPSLKEIVRDASRFIMYHKWVIENTPLQAYASALVFSPTRSLVRTLFKEEEPEEITIKPVIRDRWSSCLQTLEAHSDPVTLVVASRDSTWLASMSAQGIIKLWNATSGECLQTLTHPRENDDDIVDGLLAFSDDSTRLVSASLFTTKVILWDVSSGKCLQTLKDYWGVIAVAFSNDLVRLVSASYDGTVKLWDASSRECLQTLRDHSGLRETIPDAIFNHNLTRLATYKTYGFTVNLWDLSSGECLYSTRNAFGIKSAAFSHDSAWLALALDHKVEIIDVSSGECLQTLKHSMVTSVAFSHDSARLASASKDGSIQLWDAISSECPQAQELAGHSRSVNSIALSHNSTRLASASDDGTIKLWDANSHEEPQMVDSYAGTIRFVAFSHDSKQLASLSEDRAVKIWDTSSGECLRTFRGHSDWVRSVAFSHDSKQLASASSDCTVKIWDTSSGECLRTLRGDSSLVYSAVFSYNSERLASTSIDRVRIWDTSSGECLRTFRGHSDGVMSVAFSHDSKQLASGSSDRMVKIWDTSSGECLRTFRGHSAWVRSVAFSHDSKQFASAAYDGLVKLWDVSNGDCLQTINLGGESYSLSFDATSSYLYTDRGAVVIDPSLVSNTPLLNSEPREPQYEGWALSSDREWITNNSEKKLWLPPEYRPKLWTVSSNTIAIGTAAGRVWIFKLGLDAS